MAKFEKVAQLLDVPTGASSVSEDKQAVTISFNGLSAILEGFKGQSVETKVQSLSFELEDNQEALVINHIVRGFVDIGTGTKAVLLAQVGNRTVTINFDENQKDFCESFDATLQSGADYLITFVLLLEKQLDEADNGTTLTIDSLDLEFVGAKKENS